MWRSPLLVAILACVAWQAQAQTILNIVSRDDSNAHYALAMVELGLDKAGYDHKLSISTGALSAARQIEDTREGSIDIIWAATDAEIESQLLPVRVPLYKGLLGHRVFIIHRDNRNLFADVTRWEQMQEFVFGQGRGWPDTAIMEHNGLKVEVGTYEGLFLMTDGKRFDAFPRGVHEPWSEVEARPELELAIDEHVMFVYRMPFYLFVSPERPELAEALTRGLLMAVEDGSFDELFFDSPTVQMVLEVANIEDRQVFELENPELPEQTPVDDERLWLDLSQMN